MSRPKLLRSIIFPLALLVAAGGVYFYLMHRQGAEEPAVDDDRIVLSKHEKNAVLRMELETTAGRVVLVKGDGEWQVEEPYPVTLNQARVDDIAYSFSRLFAERVVEEDPEDLGLYGLEKPRATARAVLEDQSELLFYLGDKTSVGDSYYLQVGGSPVVYTVWRTHGDNFQAALDDLRERRLPRVIPEQVEYFRRKWPGVPEIEIRRTPELAEGEEETEFRLGFWQMELPYARPQWVEGTEFTKAIQGLSMLWIDEFVDDHPTDLARYGLANPRGELLVQAGENTLHLFFGEEKQDGLVYFKSVDADNVYAMRKSRLSLMEMKPFALVEKFILLAFIDKVEEVVVEAGEEEYTLTIERLEKPKAKRGKKEEEESAAIYRINGREMEEETFKKLYQEIIGLRVDTENDRKPVAGEPEIRVNFVFSTSDRQKISYGFVPYDKDFYVVIRDGTADFLIARNRVEKMLAAVRAQALL
ncbi:MAG: DUF4340 domain-containing protein [Firmicutes bacterium]|nr:DUF4340 domain-containing protein [Bacillota bacterium]